MGSRRTAPILIKIVFVLVFSGLLAYWAWIAITKYLDQPVATFVSYTQGDDNTHVTFPHVTFCDENFVINDPQLKSCVTHQNDINAKALGQETPDGSNFLSAISKCLKKGIDFDMNDHLKSLEKTKLKEFIVDHQLTEHTFNKSFHTKYDLKYGLCVEFDASNAGMTVDDPDVSLFLKLSIPTAANSIKTKLHTSTDYPDACFLYACFNLRRSILQTLALKKFMVTREPTRKSFCVDYNPKTCAETKSNQEIMKKFNCKLMFLQTGDHLNQYIEGYADLPICNDTSVMIQAIATFEEAMKNDEECSQAVSCQRPKFDVSSAEYGDGRYAYTYFQMIYQDLEVEHFVTYISYDAQNLICELGGVLGMFLGLSGVSVGYFFADWTERYIYDRVDNSAGTCCKGGFTRKLGRLRKNGIRRRRRGKTIWLIISVANIGLLALIILLAGFWPSENVEIQDPEPPSSTEPSTTTLPPNARTCYTGYEDKAPYITSLNGHCYYVAIEVKDYNSAVINCKIMFGTQAFLAEPQNVAENNDMYDWATEVAQTTWFWIGINNVQNENAWVYQSSGLPAAVQNWYPGEPDSFNEHCVGLGSNGLWNDDLCDLTKSFICQYNTTSPFPITETPGSEDPELENCTQPSWVGDGYCDDITNIPECQLDGGDCCLSEPVYTFCSSCQCLACHGHYWNKSQYITALDGLCYYVETEIMNYSSAVANCKTLFGSEASLAEPQNLAENEIIHHWAKDLTPYDLWIGVNDILNEDVWVYQSSGLQTVYQNWYTDQPNSYNGDQDCVELFGYNGKWNDEYCIAKSSAICQYNSSSPYPVTVSPSDPGLENCTLPSWVGDGFCDDLTNTPDCKMDGGDCCLPKTDKSFCTRCYCLGICEEGYEDKGQYFVGINEHCYYAENDIMDYKSALANCKSLFGSQASLAEPQTLEENNDIYRWASDILPSSAFWIGMNDIEQEGVWVYQSSGLPLAYQNWYPGEPNDHNGNEDCADLISNGKLNDVFCFYEMRAICQFNLTSTVPATEIPGSEDPGLENCTQPSWVADGFCDDLTNTPDCQMDGGDCCLQELIKSFCDSCQCLACHEHYWDKSQYITDLNGQCYYVETELMDYSSAIANCKALFGAEAFLAEPQNDAENEYIYYWVIQLTSYDLWIGVNDIEIEDIWVYQSSGLPATYFNWSPGEPNDGGGIQAQDCVDMAISWSTAGKWDDDGCQDKLQGAICQFNSSSPYPVTVSPSDPGLDNCTLPSWVGDGYCDDYTNIPDCQMDGGDCCLPEPIKKFCTSCQCFDELCLAGFDLLADGNCDEINNIAECDFDSGDCSCESVGAPGWIGNGWCDDMNNIAVCNYDGGDCCLGAPDWIGDGWCDDMNNIAVCNYDGGDCCLDNVLTNYCTVCECIEN